MKLRRALIGLGVLGVGLLAVLHGRAEQVVFSEVMYHPSEGFPEYIEVYNNTATPLDIARWRLRGGVDYDFPDFTPADPTRTFLRPFERIVLSPVDESILRAAYGIPSSVRVFGPWEGNLDNGGESIRLEDKNRVAVCRLTYDDRGHWPLAADGTGHSLVLKNPDGIIDDWRNWTFSQRPHGNPGSQPAADPETPVSNPEINLSEGIPFVELSDRWRYHDQNQNLGTAWRAPGFDDSSWAEGPGLLGFETAALPAPGIQTALADFDQLTYYLRTRFDYSGPTAGVTISIDQVIDDGVVYYLNGVELGRVGMGGGTVSFTTAANRTVSDATLESNVISVPGTALVNGQNVLAAELHQVNTTSSDVVFGARLKISVPNQPSVVINEVLPGAAGFVEFYNPGPSVRNLRDHYLSDTAANLTKHRIDTDLIVPAGGFVTVGFADSNLSAGSLTTVFLTSTDGSTVVNAISAPIPLDGRSMGRKPAGSSSWFLFVDPTRGGANASQSAVAAALRPSEIHFSAANTVDWIEFFNSGDAALSLEGLYVAGRRDLSDKIALHGEVMPGGYASVDVNLPLNGGELALYVVNGSGAVLYARLFERSAYGAALQTYPAGADEWYVSGTPSRDAANAPARRTEVVINEIMYDPPSDEVSGEFIELHNRGAIAVDVSNWRLVDGVDFTLPMGASIPAGGYLVVAADEAWMRAMYGNLAVVGNWQGRLRNGGELIRLVDERGNLVDEVDYQAGGSWPGRANGGGTSLELKHSDMDNSLASAWADSDETAKPSFRSYSYSDLFRQLRADGAPTDYKELHLHLVGDGHVILKNIQVRLNGTGPNLIVNGHAMSPDGASSQGWLAQGTHWASHLEGGQLHVIADGHGDNRANRVEIDVTGMNVNQSYTVSFEGKWVWGNPRLVVQTWDHSIATSFALDIPNNLGTPGARNSQAASGPAAQVDQILHQPAVPTAADPVLITARVGSQSPLGEVRLFHRPDNNDGNAPWASQLMFDDGANGDQAAGDGVFSARLTSHMTQGRIVQFYVRATAANGQFTQLPRGGVERPAMYVVDTPIAAGDLRRMRFILSAFDLRAISNQDGPTGTYGYKFPRLSNHYFNSTIIVNETEIIYGCELRNSGSPWTRGGNLDRGKFKFPKDRLFRGKEKLSFDNDAAGGARHHNRITRYWLYLFGHPANENEYVRMKVNTGGISLREEVEPYGNDLLNRLYEEGSKGELYRIDDEWWFTDSWSRSSRNADWSYKGTDNPGRYWTEWMKRSREDDHDFSALVGLFRKVNQGYTQTEIERLVDAEAVAKMSAVRGYIYDWDSFSLNRGKNGYMYRRSTDGRFMFMHWDSDLAFQDVNNIFYNGMPGFGAYLQRPYNFRLFKHYLARLVEEFARNSARMNGWLQAEEAASSQYTVSGSYQTWFQGREGPAFTLLGANRTAVFNITSNGGSTINTSAATVDLAGIAPLRAFKVVVQGHPEASFLWSTESNWSITGIRLQSGLNLLTVHAVTEEGQILHTDTINVNKTGNALPVMALEAKPASWRVPAGQPFPMSAGGSYDPDGSALSFQWTVSPATGVLLDGTSGSDVTALIAQPGLYVVSVLGQDSGGGTSLIQREIAVYGSSGFSPFNDPVLEPFWQGENVAVRDNALSDGYYSLIEEPGHLVLKVPDDVARPLGASSPVYPYVWRAVPPSTDWTFMGKVGLRGQQFASFKAGLLAQFQESGATVRYAFCLDGGTRVSVERVAANGAVSVLATMNIARAELTLRLRKSGAALVFEHFADGVWSSLHSRTLPAGVMAERAGLFVATQSALVAKAAFDFALLVDPEETSPLRDSLRISELMYNPAGGSDYEFVELVNIGSIPLDLTGVYFSDGIDYTFPNVLLGPGQYLVVVANRDAFVSRYGQVGINLAPGVFSGRLDNAGETIELSDAQGGLILSLTYDDSGGWPTSADGEGFSLEIIDPAGALNDPANWRASLSLNGSPGGRAARHQPTVVIHEVLTHTDPPLEDAIELRNLTTEAVNIGGWFLSDSRMDYRKYQIDPGVVVPPGGYVVFYEEQFNAMNPRVPFALSSVNGDQVYLSAANAAEELTGYRSEVEFGPAANGASFGRYETSLGPVFTAMSGRSFGQDAPDSVEGFRSGQGLPNPGPRVGPVVINEVMYHPPSVGADANTRDEFIELHNLGSAVLGLFDPAASTNTWRLRDGVDFDFPMGVTLGPRGFLLVVSFDPEADGAALAAFRAVYSLPLSVPVYGPYSGQLANGGERVALQRPDSPQGPGPDEGVVPYILVDEVVYDDAWPWPVTADGSGHSLQRRRPWEYGNDPVNWKAEEPTAGRANVVGSGYTDSDADGMDDAYELAHQFAVNDPSDALQDTDGDGRTNVEEYHDGTNPRQAGSRLTGPLITVAPEDRSVDAGQNTGFSVLATGTGPLEYQWRVNGATLPGETNSSLFLSAVQASEAGAYSVVVWNPAGFVLSEPARLFVRTPLTIVGQPTHRIVERGSTAVFEVFALGTGVLRYQWRHNGVDILGATHSSLVLSNAQVTANGAYTVRVQDDNTTVISASATLQVLTPPVILAQPLDQTQIAYMDVTFTVMAGGDGPFSYQWRFNGLNLTGQTNATLHLGAVQPGQAGAYSVTVFNPSSSVSSREAILTLRIPAEIIQHPQAVKVWPGADVTFQVTATSSTPIRYQWRFNNIEMAGATNAILFLAAVQPAQDGQYTVTVTDGIGPITSQAARLTVLVAPSFVLHPVSQTAVENGTVTFSVLTAGTLPMGYRWRKAGSSVLSVVLDSHVSLLTLSGITASDAARYTVVITNEAFHSPGFISQAADLFVESDQDGDGLPDAWEVAHGLDPMVDDAHADPDGDGFTNAQEFEAGTDPQDPRSYLKVEDIVWSNSVSIRFLARPGRTYSVLHAQEVEGPYVKLVDVAAGAEERLVEAHDIVDPGQKRYYRLATPAAP